METILAAIKFLATGANLTAFNLASLRAMGDRLSSALDAVTVDELLAEGVTFANMTDLVELDKAIRAIVFAADARIDGWKATVVPGGIVRLERR